MILPSDVLHVSICVDGQITVIHDAKKNKYAMASGTKTIKSIMIANAISQDLISSIDDSIKDYIVNLPQDYHGISIKDLLTMSSGICWPKPFEKSIPSSDVVEYILKNDIKFTGNKIFDYKPDSALILKLLEIIYGKKINRVFAEMFNVDENDIKWENNFSNYSGAEMKPEILHKIACEIQENTKEITNSFFNKMFIAQNTGGFPENMPYGYLCWEIKKEDNPGFFAAGFGGQRWYVSKNKKLSIVIFRELSPNKKNSNGLLFDLITEYE